MIGSLSREVNPNKAAGIRELGRVDVAALTEAILALPDEAWDKAEDFEANYNKGKAIRQAAHIIFRFGDRRTVPFTYFNLPVWDEWAERLTPVMEAAVEPYGYARGFFPRIMLASLPGGAFIRPHVDGDPSVSIPHKIHIPITTNPQTFFFVGEQRCHMPAGCAYEVNNAARHAVVNGGTSDRIHLIFEYLDADLQPFDK